MTTSLLRTLLAVLVVGACSGTGATQPPATASTTPATPPTNDTTPATPLATTSTTQTTTTTSTSTSPATEAPTTTIDPAEALADAEAAFLTAFSVGIGVLREPDAPGHEELLRTHYGETAISQPLENLQRTIDGNYIAVENESNPTFARVVEPAQFVDGDPTLARMTVCEFISDRIFEIGTAPDGGDALVRDDPVSILSIVTMRQIDGLWKLESGIRGEEIRDENERCSAE